MSVLYPVELPTIDSRNQRRLGLEPRTSDYEYCNMHMDKLKTDPDLLAKLKSGAAKKLSAQELFEQRISFIYGCLDFDSLITKEQIRDSVRSQIG